MRMTWLLLLVVICVCCLELEASKSRSKSRSSSRRRSGSRSQSHGSSSSHGSRSRSRSKSRKSRKSSSSSSSSTDSRSPTPRPAPSPPRRRRRPPPTDDCTGGRIPVCRKTITPQSYVNNCFSETYTKAEYCPNGYCVIYYEGGKYRSFCGTNRNKKNRSCVAYKKASCVHLDRISLYVHGPKYNECNQCKW